MLHYLTWQLWYQDEQYLDIYSSVFGIQALAMSQAQQILNPIRTMRLQLYREEGSMISLLKTADNFVQLFSIMVKISL